MIFFRARRYDQAIQSIACLNRGLAMNDGPVFRTLLAHVYGRAGETAKALEILEYITALSSQRYVSPADFAMVYAGLGDANSTFRWLEKAYETRAIGISQLPSMYFDSVRSDPRYEGLRKRIGLPA
jgi:hypothetical protein